LRQVRTVADGSPLVARANRSPHLGHGRGSVSDSGVMSAYMLEIKAVVLRGDGPVGYGVDDLGRLFAVSLDLGLAANVATALDEGRRPIVAVERGRSIPAIAELAVADRVMARRDKRVARVVSRS